VQEDEAQAEKVEQWARGQEVKRATRTSRARGSVVKGQWGKCSKSAIICFIVVMSVIYYAIEDFLKCYAK
jgi:hypothetical protein